MENTFAKIKDTMQVILGNKACLILSVVAAAVALLSFIVFIVALARKHHKRGAAQILFLIFGSLLTIAFIIILALAVAVVYNPFNVFKYIEIAENYIAKLFKLSDLNAVNVTLSLMGLFGVVLFAVTVGLTLFAMIAVSVKTKKIKKADKPATEDLSETTESAEDDVNPEKSTEDDSQPEESAEDSEKPAESVDEPDQEIEQEEKPTDKEIEESHNIVNEIDALVTGEQTNEDDDVSEQLKQAILEGYALSDAYLNLDDISVDEQSVVEEVAESVDEEPLYESVAEEEQTQPEENLYESVAEENYNESEPEEEYAQSEENYVQTADDESEQEPVAEEQEPNYEDYAFYNDEQAQNAVYEESEKEPEEVAKPQPQPEPERAARVTPQSVATPYAVASHRVRTIVRRPTARSADELIKRVSDEPAPKSKPADPQPKKATQPAPKKQAAKTDTAKKTPQKRTKPVEVQAQEQKLPITRKYIILNRRNAATVFNEYLNGKKEQDKKKITDNLNTVIIK